jgi:hypothetical protein
MATFTNFNTVVDKTSVAPISEQPMFNATELQGVTITTDTPIDGDVLVYDSGTGKYELFQAPLDPTLPIYNANKLQGVPITTDAPSNGDVLVYNNITSEYELQSGTDLFTDPIAIGTDAGQVNQGVSSIAIGTGAGKTNQGTESIAIGHFSGETNQHANSIILNASGSALNSDGASRYYVKPVRNNNTSTNKVVQYNTTTSEVSYNTLGLPTSTIVGVDDTQNLTNKSLEDSTTFFYDNVDNTKKLQFQLSSITTGTTRTLTAPDVNDTITGISATQTLTNKTLTRPVITSEATPAGSTGMLYFDSTANKLCFFNGTFWEYINLYTPITVTLSVFSAVVNSGVFALIPVYTAIGGTTAPTTGTAYTIPVVGMNGWTASAQITYTIIAPTFQRIAHTTPAIGNYLDYNYGTQSRGIYELTFFTTVQTLDGFMTVTETTSGTTITEYDNYYNGTASIIFSYTGRFVFNPGADTGTMKIRWICNSKNTNSTNYRIGLNNYIKLVRVG